MTQGELFSDERYRPPARATDKETSHQGAEYLRPKLGAKQREFLRRLLERGKPSTANEVARGDETIRKRAKELVRAGVIAEVGTRVCAVTGQNATVYGVK